MEIHWHFFNAPQVTRTRIECPRPRLIFSLNKREPADRIQSNEDQMMYPVTQFVSMRTVLSMAPGQSPERPPASVSVSIHLFWTGGWAVPPPRQCTPLPVGGQCWYADALVHLLSRPAPPHSQCRPRADHLLVSDMQSVWLCPNVPGWPNYSPGLPE